MTREEIKSLFLQQIDCSQVVADQFAEELQMDKDMLRKMSACFGGGMQCGETCGAVTGALMVIGLKYGHYKEDDLDQKVIMMKKVAEFKEKFAEKYPSCLCRDLLGHDISKPGEFDKVLEENLMMDFCPGVVETAIEILKELGC